MFADILCDCANYETVEDNRAQAEMILAGFIDAIDDWMKYHDTAYKSFQELRDNLLKDVYGSLEALEREEEALPTIPPFPSLLDARKVN